MAHRLLGVGCGPSYDPAGAKKLLADAGYPNGFDLTLSTWGPSRRIAEAVAGQLRKVGINAKVDSSTVGVFVQKRADGKIQTPGVAVGQRRRAAGHRIRP